MPECREIRFTYNFDPEESDLSAVRFRIGDTNHKRPLLDDREVEWAITKHGNLDIAAAVLCESLYARFLGISDVKVGPVSKSYSKVAQMYKDKADQLRSEACKYAAPSFPATRYSTKCKIQQDSDLPPPELPKGMGDNPFAASLNERLNTAGFNGF